MPQKRHFLFMAYYTYILKSKIKDRLYIGSCSDLTKRLEHHNLGHSKSTKGYIPWEIVYFEEYKTKSESIKREYALKKLKSKEKLIELIECYDISGGRPESREVSSIPHNKTL